MNADSASEAPLSEPLPAAVAINADVVRALVDLMDTMRAAAIRGDAPFPAQEVRDALQRVLDALRDANARLGGLSASASPHQ